MKALGKMVEEQGIQIPWSTISKRMVKRSRLSCFKKWQKMSGCMSPGDEYGGGSKRDKDDDDEEDSAPVMKRAKRQENPYAVAPTAGAAAAMAAGQGDYDVYTAKIAAETVEAVDLPDTDALVPTNVRDV